MSVRKSKILRIKIIRLLIVLAGIIAGQLVLYGPSLIGKKILLPLDVLGLPSVYLPSVSLFPHNEILGDLVEQWEPARQFAISEFHAGRLPMWNPYQFAGCPVVWPKFSPFLLLECITNSPVILAWTQLFAAVIAGFGFYIFLRRALSVTFWAAAIPAWCYPLTGFFIFWQGFPTCFPVFWFPWLLLAIDGTIRRSNKFSPIGLALVTGLVLVSGALDVAGQVLLMSGFYAIWCVWDEYKNEWFHKPARRVMASVAIGWLFGFMLAAPYLLPLLEYAQTGARMERRSGGNEERPPAGISALPQIILPDIYGCAQKGSLRLISGNQNESSAAGYAGLIGTLLVAPLGWCSRRHRSKFVFWCLAAFFGVSWCLNVPGIVAFLRLPVLNMMSHNRLVFATSFAILALAAIGLDALWRRIVQLRWFFFPFPILLVGLFAWCFYHTWHLPETVATGLAPLVAQNGLDEWIHDAADFRQIQTWFVSYFSISATLCAASMIGWLFLFLRPRWPRWTIVSLGILMTADLLRFAYGRSTQCDPALYYPRIPALEAIAQSAPGRVIGYNCLPATLAETHGLRDIRGYDAIDPAQLTSLMSLAAKPIFHPFSYALTQWFLPAASFSPPDGIHLSPILDMLNVRYVILRGRISIPPDIQPLFQSPDYWVILNHAALPRAFVPKQVETIADASTQLQKMGAPKFDPRETAYVETPVDLPDTCDGRAEIISEIPTRVVLSAQMKTPGLVVLADLWDKGWNAYLNGRRVPILRANLALRGVIVPSGTTTLEFRYEPASFRHGLQLAGLAAAGLALWLSVILLSRKSAQTLR